MPIKKDRTHTTKRKNAHTAVRLSINSQPAKTASNPPRSPVRYDDIPRRSKNDGGRMSTATAICMTVHDAKALKNFHFLSFSGVDDSSEKCGVSLVFCL
jgi:hypothetical protein